MTNAKMTRRALLSSVLALVLCFTMLLGTTFAWFTDEAVSSGNIIKSGNLQVGLYYADGTEAIPNKSVSNWKDASENPIFSFYNEEWEKTYWEPGYVQANHIMIKNEGNLAFKYVVSIIPQGDAGILADVIDVYYFPTATQIADRSALTDDYYVGTLADLMSDSDGAARGVLIPANETPDNDFEVAGEQMVTIALKMRESAGNEYQNLTVGNEWGGILGTDPCNAVRLRGG